MMALIPSNYCTNIRRPWALGQLFAAAILRGREMSRELTLNLMGVV